MGVIELCFGSNGKRFKKCTYSCKNSKFPIITLILVLDAFLFINDIVNMSICAPLNLQVLLGVFGLLAGCGISLGYSTFPRGCSCVVCIIFLLYPVTLVTSLFMSAAYGNDVECFTTTADHDNDLVGWIFLTVVNLPALIIYLIAATAQCCRCCDVEKSFKKKGDSACTIARTVVSFILLIIPEAIVSIVDPKDNGYTASLFFSLTVIAEALILTLMSILEGLPLILVISIGYGTMVIADIILLTLSFLDIHSDIVNFTPLDGFVLSLQVCIDLIVISWFVIYQYAGCCKKFHKPIKFVRNDCFTEGEIDISRPEPTQLVTVLYPKGDD